jgi:competence protein ComEC
LVVTVRSPPPLEPGPFEGAGRLFVDPVEGRFGDWAIAEVEFGTLLLDFRTTVEAGRGDVVWIHGEVRGEPGRRGAHEYRARLRVRSIRVIEESRSLPMALGDALRDRVMTRLAPFDDRRGLLAGFLIGDTSQVDPIDVEAMRLSGLSHFVAVSGSNVALFLGLVAVAAGPLAMGARSRALVGLAAIPIYAAATRFEPSVLRASVMAGLALGGRLIGVALEAWQLLSLAVIALLVAEPGLTGSAGFQLSVAATAGVLVGARWPVQGKVSRALAVTAGAQIGVAPLILAHFGSVPLLSPLINLIAAPFVATSTVVGAIGVAGPGFLVDLGAWLAGLVLTLSRGASTWPQTSALPLIGLAVAGLAVLRWPALRPGVAVLAAGAVVTLVIGGGGRLPAVGVVVLDVGQGDAILIHSEGRFALVDGGPDPVVLIDRLNRYGVSVLDLVVLSHVHADHATGLVGLIDRIPIRTIWESTAPHETSASTEFLEAAAGAGIPVTHPVVGERVRFGELTMEILGPLRRYSSPNDQSIVLMVEGPGRSMLLSGDIETFAQTDLTDLRADVLKVPHQGAATSDPEWLDSVGSSLAVISVGPNQFGHPVDWVIETLEGSGAAVLRTDEDGDVVVPLS